MKEKNALINSLEMTLELHKAGFSMPEIAYKRKLAFSTIENHIRILLGQKRTRIEELLSPTKIELIKKAVNENPNKGLTEIKNIAARFFVCRNKMGLDVHWKIPEKTSGSAHRQSNQYLCREQL
ncbi:MAG: helix-turn-helix domain-containing protein [Candidatus Diapherotrites archaeon]|uniref:Helix-turn-helix domain-containing protein n=1 Tax=Candidatus Iainarchaeum sp. TaxID=3101447 RepID=A0A8T4LEV0_9ARCH|nr:helix-turn-helix domain-containing protein [Candidatus Diapherotrites archaeon]